MRRPSKLLALIATVVAPALVSAQTFPVNDPRTNLKPGRFDAGVAASNMRLVSFSRKPAQFDSARGLTFINSDVAFGNGHYAYQGNFAGFTVWDVSNPAAPVVMSVVECITSQGDPTIVGNLLFVSAEGGGNRNDCGKGGVQDPQDHMAGVRIFDVSNPRAPKLIKNVQTCKGSHTHTLIPSPTDRNIVYLYVSGGQGARPETELAGCKNGTDPADTTNSLYRLDIIKVPLDHPEQAAVIGGARIFIGLEPTPECVIYCATPTGRPDPAGGRGRRGGGRGGRGGRGGAPSDAANPANPVDVPVVRTGPRACHDVTSYPALNLLAAACQTHAILVDISNPEKPVRLSFLTDTNNFQGRHTSGFSNDGTKTLWTDEWGGGTGPMCQAGSIMELGGNTIITASPDNKKLTQGAYFKLLTAQTAQENCVSHNGGLIPVPGRDLYVQGWYQGGVNVMDFTDANRPIEIAYYDRGPIDAPSDTSNASGRSRFTIGGSWGAYYWNGFIYSSELDRGFDVYELTPSPYLSANEIAAAKLVTLREYNPQSQPRLVWPAAFPVVRSYLDQLVRNRGLAADRTTAIATALDAAEAKTGAARGAALTALARQVDGYASGAADAARVRMMSSEIRRLAAVSK